LRKQKAIYGINLVLAEDRFVVVMKLLKGNGAMVPGSLKKKFITEKKECLVMMR
jgi:hypothetical protein